MESASGRRLLLAILIVVLFTIPAEAYGPLGHEIVGAIADERLVNTATAAKVYALLDGLTLERAAVIADEIKGWDKKGVDNPKSFHYSAHRNIDRQLRDFWRTNQPTHEMNSAAPSHHWFHYTDVPVVPPQKYRDGNPGRSKWDIVHMIPYCIHVLQGQVPEQNERKITKPVALLLLAHYVADIHQPLHVGAEYFDAQGRATDPDKDKSALGDEGGNTFTLALSDEPPRRRGIPKKNFHAFWDYDAVNALFPQARNWRMPPNVSLNNYAEMWADEILPIAREAHERVQFRNVHPQQEEDRVVAAGEAVEKPQLDQLTYRTCATNVVRDELHKAGWRLADLLEKVL